MDNKFLDLYYLIFKKKILKSERILKLTLAIVNSIKINDFFYKKYLEK